MIKILFICHGNICRSCMAEFICKEMLRQAGLEKKITVSSAAVSREEIGNDMYPPAKDMLRQKHIPFERRAARQVTETEMESYDLILAMDHSNLRWLSRMFGDRYAAKTRLLMSYTSRQGDVSDPWYTDDFLTCYEDISEGCRELLKTLDS